MLPDDARAALRALGIRVLLDEPLRLHCSFGVGGPADIYVPGPSEEEVVLLIRWAKQSRLPVLHWTGTDNVIASDAGVRGLVLGPLEVPGGAVRRMFEEPARGSSIDSMVASARMRGVRVRGARICPHDGNALRNEGDATARDVVLLMDSVRRRVARDWGLQLVDSLAIIGRRRRR